MNPPLINEEITQACTRLPGWSVERAALAKTFKFGSFREAMSFIVRVSYEAEALNHHPEWSNVYNRVTIVLRTHSAGNTVTEKDRTLAAAIDKLVP